MPDIEANGVRLHYRLDGPTEGPVLVLSHSVGTTLQMWRPQMEALNSRVRILRYDTRGHGSSSVPTGEYAVDDLGRDLVALLDHLELSRVSLCGLSLGGLVAMWMGIHAKDRLERLVLANTAAYLGPPENWQARIDLVREQGTVAPRVGIAEGASFRGQIDMQPPQKAAVAVGSKGQGTQRPPQAAGALRQ